MRCPQFCGYIVPLLRDSFNITSCFPLIVVLSCLSPQLSPHSHHYPIFAIPKRDMRKENTLEMRSYYSFHYGQKPKSKVFRYHKMTSIFFTTVRLNSVCILETMKIFSIYKSYHSHNTQGWLFTFFSSLEYSCETTLGACYKLNLWDLFHHRPSTYIALSFPDQ